MISPEKVFFVITKAREYAVKDAPLEADPASNASDDNMRTVLEDRGVDPVGPELASFIGSMSADEQIDLVTIAWLGREDYVETQWDEVRAEAADQANDRTAEYLLGMPHLAEHLENGLDKLDISLDDYELNRL